MVSTKDVEAEFYTQLDNLSFANASPEVERLGGDYGDSLPVVVFEKTEFDVDYNNASNGVWGVVENSSGEVVQNVYRDYVQDVFTIWFGANDNELVHEMSDTVRDHFKEYKTYRHPSDFLSTSNHVDDVELDAREFDPEFTIIDARFICRQPVSVTFHREVLEDGKPIRQTNIDIEDINYTVT